MFMKKIVNLYNVTCPVKKVKVRECNKYKPWITTGLKKMHAKRKNSRLTLSIETGYGR